MISMASIRRSISLMRPHSSAAGCGESTVGASQSDRQCLERSTMKLVLSLAIIAALSGAGYIASPAAAAKQPSPVPALRAQVASLKRQVALEQGLVARLQALNLTANNTVQDDLTQLASLRAQLSAQPTALTLAQRLNVPTLFTTTFAPLREYLAATYGPAGSYSRYQGSGGYVSYTFTCFTCGG